MTSELLPITFNKIMQTRTYTVIILGTNKKKFAIYTDPNVGQNIQAHLVEKKKTRPSTHALISRVFKGLNIIPLQIVIQDVEDTVYFARLFLEQEVNGIKTILEIDARPSDCIFLAFSEKVPIFCRKEVLEKAVPVEE